MERIIKQLKSAAKDTRLSPVEKAAIKSQLLHYVKSHPAGSTHRQPRSIPSPFTTFRNKKTLSAFVIGGLLIGSTVSFAAENTVPGDALYPVKIHINEPILAAVAVTPQAKADWEVTKAERRLVEVEKLATASTPSPQVKALAEESFSASTNQVRERIARFEDTNDGQDALRTAGKFADMLRKHEGDLDETRVFASRPTMSATMQTAEVATSSAQIATTTPVQVPPVSKNKMRESARKDLYNSYNDVLGNIRNARGDAEKIQNDLMTKYNSEAAQRQAYSPAMIATTTPAQSESSRNDYRANFDRRDHGLNEELRAMSKPTQEGSAPDRNQD